MRHHLPLLLLLIPGLVYALPALKDTTLYTTIAQDCHDVDLATWQHPTRTLLEKNNFQLERIQPGITSGMFPGRGCIATGFQVMMRHPNHGR